jgi:hypothetical protein
MEQLLKTTIDLKELGGIVPLVPFWENELRFESKFNVMILWKTF